MKGIRLLQERSDTISEGHAAISSDFESIKQDLVALGAEEIERTQEHADRKQELLKEMSEGKPLRTVTVTSVCDEAEKRYPGEIGLRDILSIDDGEEVESRINRHVLDFNRRYNLDGWDYAIAGSCGLFAAMLDILCVSAPLKPTTPWTEQVDGKFNRWVQDAFNKILPKDLSEELSKGNPIGAPDSSTVFDLIDPPPKALNPTNHRLRSLAHDPILGVIFGVWDMIHNTCTIVVDGKITSIPSTKVTPKGNIFQLIGRMFGHLLSDVNAPSGNGNRGMGLPAPFMGLLRMFEGIPVGDSNLGKQIEWMYVNGYDFRQFMATSIPLAIMEVLLRTFYVVKQVRQYDEPFGKTLLDTMPLRINPRFRMMLALSYGVVASVNAGKMYVTENTLNANYAAWMGLVWNGFHALKWALAGRQLKLWGEVEEKEIKELESLILNIEQLENRAACLPT
jgi:hypothetical protein